MISCFLSSVTVPKRGKTFQMRGIAFLNKIQVDHKKIIIVSHEIGTQIMEQEELELKEQLKEIKKRELLKRKEESNSKRGTIEEKPYEPTAIYISQIPREGIDERSLIEEFSKYGSLRKDQEGNPKCKLYRDAEGRFKGDALVVYSRKESVPIAIAMMDGYTLNGSKIKVEVAKFSRREKRSLEEEPDPQSQRKKLPKTFSHDDSLEKMPVNEEGSIDINEERSRTIKVTNIIDIYEMPGEEELNDIKRDIQDGCEAIGHVENIKLHDSLGEATITFKEEASARKCVNLMNGRYFDGRKLLSFMIEDENASQTSMEEIYSLDDDLIE